MATKKKLTPEEAEELRRQYELLLDKPLWTIEDLALYLTETVGGVRKMRQMGTLPRAQRGGRRLYWRRRDVDAWLEANADPETGIPDRPRQKREG